MKRAQQSIKPVKPGIYGYDFILGGKRYRRYFRGLSKEEVEALYFREFDRARRIKYGLENLNPPKPVEFKVFADEFLENYAAKKKSYETYVYHVERLKAFFGRKALDSIAVDEIESYQKRREKEVSAASVNREIACLSAIFSYAMRKDKVSKNPVRKIGALHEEPKERRILTDDEIGRLLQAIEKSSSPYLRGFVIISLNTGMRPSEVLSLRWRDIDFVRGSIRIKSSKTDKGKDKGRIIPMNEAAAAAIRAIKKRNDNYLFFSAKSRGPVRGIKRSFAKACRDAKIKGITPYCLRHTVISKWVNDLGVDIVTAGKLAGHSKVEMTLRYCHPKEEHFQRAVASLGEFMAKKASTRPETTVTQGPISYSSAYN